VRPEAALVCFSLQSVLKLWGCLNPAALAQLLATTAHHDMESNFTDQIFDQGIPAR
jgi:hypothetical protein